MKAKFGREMVLLSLPVLLIGGVAWWKTRTTDPLIRVEALEVGAVSLESEVSVLTGAQAQRRVHLAALINLPSDVKRLDEVMKSDEYELRAPNGWVRRLNPRSTDVVFDVGGWDWAHRNSPARQWRKLHWMVTIPADAPKQDLTFSARVEAPGLTPRTVRFIARPAWKTRRPALLQVESVSWEHETADPVYGRVNAVVRLRYTGSKPLICDGRPLSHQIPSPKDLAGPRTFTRKAAPHVAALVWAESQWIEDSRGKILIDWRRAKGGDINYNSVENRRPYLNARDLIVVRYSIETRWFALNAPIRLKAELGVGGEGILPLDLQIPKQFVQAVIKRDAASKTQ